MTIWHADRSVISVNGDDAASFLQGQLSQDVLLVEEGSGRPALLLTPEGKLIDAIGVHRVEGTYVLDVSSAAVDLVVARLQRFCFRVKVAFAANNALQVLTTTAAAPPWAKSSRPLGIRGFSVVLATSVAEGVGTSADGRPAEIAGGVPAFGAEIVDGMVAAELGIDFVEASASFTKGCYTGQELVARVSSRGSNVPFSLKRLRPLGAVEVGEALLDVDGTDRGVVTSVATLDGAVVALGRLHRSVSEMPVVHTASGVRCDVLPV